jgi:hypothetical protein
MKVVVWFGVVDVPFAVAVLMSVSHAIKTKRGYKKLTTPMPV